MKSRLAIFLTLPLLLSGCKVTATTSPAALAPGYTTPFDQTAGQTLAAAHALVSKATTDYPSLTPAQQATEKPILNAFVSAVNTADSVYLAFHQGTATQAQVQTQLNSVATAQTAYTNQAVTP
jgi:hypothetical protein